MTTMMHNTHGGDKDFRHHQQQHYHQRRRSRTQLQQQQQQQQQYNYSSDEKIVESTTTVPIPLLYSDSPMMRTTTNVSQTMNYVLDFFFKNQQLEPPLLKQQDNRHCNSDRQRSISSSSSSSSMIFRRITLILGSMSFLILMILIRVVVVFTEQNHLQQRQQMELEFLSSTASSSSSNVVQEQQQQQRQIHNSKNDWSSFSPSSSASVFDWISTTYSPHQQHQRHQHQHNDQDGIDQHHHHHRIVGGHRIMSGLGAVPFLLTEFIQSVFSITSPSSSSVMHSTSSSSSSSATSNGPIRLPWSTASSPSSSSISNTKKDSPAKSDTASAGSSAHRRLRTSSASSSSSLPRSTSNTSSRRRRLFNRHVDEDNATAVAGTSADTTTSSSTSTSYIDEYGLRYLALGGKAFQVSNNNNNNDGGYASYPTMLSHNVRTVSSSSSSASFSDDDGFDDDDDDDNPTLASLCTQSMIGNDEIYDVITIQYPLSATAATSMTNHQRKSQILVGASSSSSSSSGMLSPSLEAIGLLLERLRQRFPDATIVFVDVWSPLDTYYYDEHDNNRRKVTFEEWRKQKQQHEQQEMDSVDNSGPSSSSSWLDDIQDHVWYLKDDVDDVESLRRRTLVDELTELVDDADALLYRLRPSESVNDALQNYFVEHPMVVTSTGTTTAAAAGDTNTFRYNLSPKAHSVMAADLESIIKTNVERTFPSQQLTPVSSSSSSSSQPQPLSPRLGTWGGGDSCQLWYEAGASMLPNQFSQGLRYIELTSTPSSSSSSSTSSLFGKRKMGGWMGQVKDQGNQRRSRRLGTVPTSTTIKAKRRYALEVKSSNDSDQMKTQDDESILNSANLQVHNPFEEDRMLYLTYLTTAATASSRKVYPRTKVHLQHEQPSSTTINPNKSGVVVLDPSHDDNSDVHHHTRTSAIGMVPAGQSSTVYFAPVEQYTEESFRIVGVSFLAKEKLTHGIKSDFHLSPHGITMEEGEGGANADDDDDDDAITS